MFLPTFEFVSHVFDFFALVCLGYGTCLICNPLLFGNHTFSLLINMTPPLPTSLVNCGHNTTKTWYSISLFRILKCIVTG